MQVPQHSLLAMQACYWPAARAPLTAALSAAALAAAAVVLVVLVVELVELVVAVCHPAMMPGLCTMVELVDLPCAGCSAFCKHPRCFQSTAVVVLSRYTVCVG